MKNYIQGVFYLAIGLFCGYITWERHPWSGVLMQGIPEMFYVLWMILFTVTAIASGMAFIVLEIWFWWDEKRIKRLVDR